MGRRPAPERSARPHGGSDLRHLARDMVFSEDAATATLCRRNLEGRFVLYFE
jgi:hypothetical protein